MTGTKSSSGISCSAHTVPNVTMRTPPKNLTTGSSFEKDETAIAHPIHIAERERDKAIRGETAMQSQAGLPIDVLLKKVLKGIKVQQLPSCQ